MKRSLLFTVSIFYLSLACNLLSPDIESIDGDTPFILTENQSNSSIPPQKPFRAIFIDSNTPQGDPSSCYPGLDYRLEPPKSLSPKQIRKKSAQLLKNPEFPTIDINHPIKPADYIPPAFWEDF